MEEDYESDIVDMLTHIDVRTRMPSDFREGSPQVVQFLSEMATYINTLVVGEFGGRLGPVRQVGLVEQVVGAAFQTFGDLDPHPGPFDKAAMLLRGITAGHPFQDGNKRTGFLLAVFYLEQLGHPPPEHLSVDDTEHLCLRISAGELRDVTAIADELQRLWQGSSDHAT